MKNDSGDNCLLLNNETVNEVPITQEQYKYILKIQNTILSMIAAHKSTETVLNELCYLAEKLLPNSVASIMLKDKESGLLDMIHAPSIPPEGIEKFKNLCPGPTGGSCGNAIYHNEPQYIKNTFTDPKWEDLRAIAYDFNLCACWSTPIRDENNNPIGTFALSSFEHRMPSSFHKLLLETASSIVSIVLKNKEHEESIQYFETALENAKAGVEYFFSHDSLTGTKNKANLELLLYNQKERYSLILLDINNFNYINSAYGFEFGDAILSRVADILSNLSPEAKLFRMTSDEFALLYEWEIDLKSVIKQIQQFFYENSLIIEDVLIKIAFNYGACCSNENLLENSALALRLSKDVGKNRYHIFEKVRDTVQKEVRDRFVVANGMIHEAIQEDRIVPYFQGIVDNKTQKIVKYEALVRIESNKEIITPSKFLDAARLSGLLPEITKIIIDKSFAIMQEREEDFSINITEEDLGRDYLISYLQKKAKEYNISPKRVTLEILEGVSSYGKKSNIDKLKALKAYGFLIAIDDFGAEYSNFERLIDMDIDFLKIDAKYIKNIDNDTKSYEIVKAIAHFAHNLSIACIAEFVHSQEVQEIVQSLDIEYSQGYYFSKPAML